MDNSKNKGQNNGNPLKMLTLITQFGISMIVPMALCFLVGIWLDRRLGTNFIAIILFFVGAVAGFSSVYSLSKKMTHKSAQEIEIEQILNKKNSEDTSENDNYERKD